MSRHIVRRTIGFGREWDAISIEQFRSGIHSRRGEPIDLGTGLSRAGVGKAIHALIAKGLVEGERQRADTAGNLPTRYPLNPDRPRPPNSRTSSSTESPGTNRTQRVPGPWARA